MEEEAGQEIKMLMVETEMQAEVVVVVLITIMVILSEVLHRKYLIVYMESHFNIMAIVVAGGAIGQMVGNLVILQEVVVVLDMQVKMRYNQTKVIGRFQHMVVEAMVALVWILAVILGLM